MIGFLFLKKIILNQKVYVIMFKNWSIKMWKDL